MIDLQKLELYLKSEEGKESIKRFRDKQIKKDIFEKRWADKFIDFIKYKTDEELTILFDKFHKHAEKRRNILWNQRYDGETSLYSSLFSAFEKLGVKSPEDAYGMFSSAVFDWRVYRMESYCGQGCFHSLSKV